MRRVPVRAWPGVLAAGLALAASGCFNPFRPVVSDEPAFVEPPPVPNTPQNLIRLFKWCWENRDDVKYREIFTADYQFAFAATDSAGSPYRTNAWRREDELIAAHNLFVAGSASDAPASNIVLTFTPEDLRPEDDLRDGKMEPWHQRIQTTVNLTVTKTDGTGFQVTGGAVFYVVRGDSADIPADLGPGFGADPNRWYIERWEDQTSGGDGLLAPATPGTAGLAPLPIPALASRRPSATSAATFLDRVTWGYVKSYYRTLR